jgi:hypothetical protein
MPMGRAHGFLVFGDQNLFSPERAGGRQGALEGILPLDPDRQKRIATVLSGNPNPRSQLALSSLLSSARCRQATRLFTVE